MSIATAIQNAQQKVADAYTALSNKGGTLPATQNLSNMPTAIGSISTGGTIDTLTVTPTTSQQTITATGGVDGYNPITVNAVTSAIDSDIKATNIKSGVNILGVNGSVIELAGETRSVSLTSSSGNTFTPSSGKNGITSITVTPNNQARTVTPTTSQQSLTVGSGYSGNGTITVNAVTSSIDNNITAGNIKKDVTILGVTGTYEGVGGVDDIDLSKITNSNLDNSMFARAFKNCTGIVSVNLSGLTDIKGKSRSSTFSSCFSSAFYGCTSLTSIDLSNLTSIQRYDHSYQYSNPPSNIFLAAFYGCTSLTSIDLSSLTIVEGTNHFNETFRNCTSLSSVNFNGLIRLGELDAPTGRPRGIFANCFRGCTNLTTVSFPNLEEIYTDYGMDYTAAMFYNWDKVQKLYFPKLSVLACYNSSATGTQLSVCKNTFKGCDSLIELHFGAANQSAIEASEGYSTAWGRGAGNVTIYFDL